MYLLVSFYDASVLFGKVILLRIGLTSLHLSTISRVLTVFNVNLHLIICRTRDDRIRIHKHDSYGSHMTHISLRGVNHFISTGTKGSCFTEKGSIIYPYPYSGLVSAFNTKATFTLISINSGMTVNGHDSKTSCGRCQNHQ
jgi:hypothetical protein